MTDKPRYGNLSKVAKDDLLTRMRKKSSAKLRPVAVAAKEKTTRFDSRFTDFTKHPEYEQIQLQSMFAEHSNIKTPYFRCHDTRAGSQSRIAGADIVNFGSYDYLGLNQAKEISKAAQEAIEHFGTSVSASRIVAGERQIHRDLEAKIAGIYETDDAIVYVSGHATNVSTIAAILNSKDLILYDAWAHNSIKMGAKLSGATIRNFNHNDPDALEAILKSCRHQYERVLVVIEGLYSMDGDTPDLARFVDVKTRYQTWLMVDEAHALGVLGKTGRGIAEEQNIPFNQIDIWMGTLSKTLASCGGYIAGSQALIKLLKFKSPGFVYSVGLPAPAAAAAIAAIDLMQTDPSRVARLREISIFALESAKRAGLNTGVGEGYAVIPIMIPDSIKAVTLATAMLERGFNMLPIIYPAVPIRDARLRLFLSADHNKEQITAAINALNEEVQKLNLNDVENKQA